MLEEGIARHPQSGTEPLPSAVKVRNPNHFSCFSHADSCLLLWPGGFFTTSATWEAPTTGKESESRSAISDSLQPHGLYKS